MDREAAYLAFARGLAARFAARVTGQDASLQRLVGVRPADAILGGFLTPIRQSSELDGDDPIDDLPQDSAYEQTSLGVEWCAPRHGLAEAQAAVTITLSIYVRVLPTWDEQRRLGAWGDGRYGHTVPTGDEETKVVPVWQRVDLPPIQVDIPLGSLMRGRIQKTSLIAEMRQAWNTVLPTVSHRFPRNRDMSVMRREFSEDGYARWCEAQQVTDRNDDWAIELDVRLTTIPTEPEMARLALRIINRTAPRSQRDAEFFDANLYAVSVTVQVPQSAHRDRIFRDLEASYRYDLSLPVVGLNCHARATRQQGLVTLLSESVPQQETGRLLPRDIEAADPTFTVLQADPLPTLRRILAAMRTYDIEVWEKKAATLTGASLEEAERDRRRFRDDEIAMFERGIALLADQRFPHVLRAFQWMNEAMAVVGGDRFTAWRLFQIVFIVARLPSLAAREHPILARSDDDDVEVLWFAAGGGKTEAFLGLIIWQAFFDRLRGKQFGTTALVRFPLRLLAFQQLQRIGNALAAADLIRRRERLGGAHFSLGYYVGSTQTPNSISDEMHDRYRKSPKDVNGRCVLPNDMLRVSQCPYCGAETRVTYDPALRIIEHRCTSGICPHGDRRLPVYIVDRDIDAFLPTVVVATVDKFAQLGQQQRFSNMLGRVTLFCPHHGASFLNTNSMCEAAKALKSKQGVDERPTSCGGREVWYGPFHDLGPALLIQDELHLLSEELGTFDAHYETAAMHMSETFGVRPWKIIAATATITDVERHVRELYCKRARQFPAPGPDANDSFYYHIAQDRVARIFVGVLGVGRKHTPAVTRALSLLYQEVEQARELVAVDPTEACKRYKVPALTADVWTEMLFYYELMLTYVLTRRGSDQVAEAIESRVKREVVEASPRVGGLRIETFNGGVDMNTMIETMRAIDRASPTDDPAERTRGLVTTNIIGHGVDVDRFNVIVFAGFTRLVAEYIQASGRVGRRFPGISVLVVTPQSERDRSIYERFAKFHQYLDRLVDPAAVNRWPTPALDKTMPGLLAGYLMGAASFGMDRRLVTSEDVQAAWGAPGSEPLDEAEIVRWMQRALHSDESPSPSYAEAVQRTAARLFAKVVNAPQAHTYRENMINHLLSPMTSLRDVDDPAIVRVESTTDKTVMRGLRRG